MGCAVLLRAQSSLRLPQSSGGRVHSVAFPSSADDEAMATEVAPPASAELTELGKCLTQQEVRAPALTATTLSLHSVTLLCGAARPCCRDRLLQHSPAQETSLQNLLVLWGLC